VSSVVNHVRISPSGLLVEIETYDAGQLTGSVQIDRSVWADVVRCVEQCLAEGRLMAQVQNLVDHAADEDGED
jgi:hypothetical protein